MAKVTGLLIKEGFHAFGVDFNKGSFVPVSAADNWPEGALQRRIENKFVEMQVRDDEPAEPADKPAPEKSDKRGKQS